MRISGLKSTIAAAGLALACVMGTQGAFAAQPANSPAPAIADPTFANSTEPTTAAAPATALPADPTLAQNGAPLMAPVANIGQPSAGGVGIQPQVTKIGEDAHWFHDAILVPLITVISLFVLALLFWVAFRYRAAANPVPSKTSHNIVLEVIWTAVPAIILGVIAFPSLQLLAAQYKPAPANAITLKATGNQWYWTYEYPDLGGIQITANMLKEKTEVAAGERFRTDADGPRLLAADNRVVLPVGVPIRLQTTAADVIHSWAVPAFWIKLDAVPGRLNETSFTIEKPGLYFGQCSELCGSRHGYMPIAVEAVPLEQFNAWVVAKGGTLPGAAPAAAAASSPDAASTTAAAPAATTNEAAPAAAAATGN